MTDYEFREKLVKSFYKLQQYTYTFTANREEADDLLQETVLKALCKRDSYRADTNFCGWLFTIMHNVYLNQVKKEKRYLNAEVENLAATLGGIQFDSRCGYRELISLLESLPPECTIPLKMYIDGYKYHEISDILAIPIGTVKSRIYAARARMQKLMM